MTSKEFGKILQDKLTSEYGVELNVAQNTAALVTERLSLVSSSFVMSSSSFLARD